MPIQNYAFGQCPLTPYTCPSFSEQLKGFSAYPTTQGSRLYQNTKREITLISKTPEEVCGEQFILPIIGCAARCFSTLRNLSNCTYELFKTACKHAYAFVESLSMPQLLPSASAAPLPMDTCSSDKEECLFKTSSENAKAALQEIAPQSRALSSSSNIDPAEELFELLLAEPNKIKTLSRPDLLPTIRDSKNLSFFQRAAKRADPITIKALLPVFKDTQALYLTDSSGKNALHDVAIQGHASLIPTLTNYFSVDSVDNQGLSPFHWAIHERHLQTVKAFLKEGASLSNPWITPDKNQYSPLAMAVAVGDPDILKLFLREDTSKQVNLKQPIPRIGTVLHLAIQTNQAPMLKFLLQNQHKDTNILTEMTDFLGRTPLQLAAYLGDLYAIKFLHAQGVDLNKGEGTKGGTALHYAALGKHPKAIEFLGYLGIKPSPLDANQQTPLALVKDLKTPSARECAALLGKLSKLGRRAMTRPVNFQKRPPENLVLTGKGIAQIGALQEMETKGLLSQLKRVAGTSGGAIL